MERKRVHALAILGHGIDMVLESRFERRREKWSETILSPTEKEIYDGLLDRQKCNYLAKVWVLKEAFVKKAIEESNKGNLCVLLIPVSTSTMLFHDYILPNAEEIRFLRGRVKFKGYNTFGELVDNKVGMHDSMVVVLKK